MLGHCGQNCYVYQFCYSRDIPKAVTTKDMWWHKPDTEVLKVVGCQHYLDCFGCVES